MTDPHSLPYRDCVGIMLLNTDNQVFVAKRIDMVSEAWQMPQGGIDEGESPEECAMRELEEEIGTANADIIETMEEWLHYDLPEHLVPKVWGGKYRGQRQKWFAMRFKGADSDINLETAEPEFSEWQWTSMASLPDLIVPFKRELYSQLVKRFQHLAQ